LGLLLLHAERSVGLADATALPDEHLGAPVLAGHLGQRLADAVHPSADGRPLEQFAWDASDDVVREQMGREDRLLALLPVIAGVAAEI
jgi:hypothetical protein